MRRLLVLAAALLGACSGDAAGRSETALRGPAPEAKGDILVVVATVQAPIYLPALAFDAAPEADVAIAAAEASVTAVGPGDTAPLGLPRHRHPVTWPDQLTKEETLAVLELAGWPAELYEEALAVAWCESRWSPGALGDRGESLGLFQLWPGWFSHSGQSPEDWTDPVVNAGAALAAYRYSGDWRQWSCQPTRRTTP